MTIDRAYGETWQICYMQVLQSLGSVQCAVFVSLPEMYCGDLQIDGALLCLCFPSGGIVR